jgi:site-specific recombinase XerD
MTRVSVDRILKDIARETGITSRVSTHTLRKTFGYHQMVMSGNSPRKLLLLQKMFGHSTSAQTLDYIGITGEEIEEAYRNLNLGMLEGYTRLGVLDETAVDTNGTVITISEATA